MDNILENVRFSLEAGVRKMFIGVSRKTCPTASDKSKPTSKVFGIPLVDLCAKEKSSVPYLVKDICTFIQKNHLDSEGIFRVPTPSARVTRLCDAFEQHTFHSTSDSGVTSSSGVDGYTAAKVLKDFFRQLPKPLVSDKILVLARELASASDESFAASISTAMDACPAAHRFTLQYLLSFLQDVQKNKENGMSSNCLAVVFAHHIFQMPATDSAGAQSVNETPYAAIETIERLLSITDLLCGKKSLSACVVTSSPTSPPTKPSQQNPAIPDELPPMLSSPLSMQSYDDIHICNLPRSSTVMKTNHDQASGDRRDCCDKSSGEQTHVSPYPPIPDETIHCVCRKNLFLVDSSMKIRDVQHEIMSTPPTAERMREDESSFHRDIVDGVLSTSPSDTDTDIVTALEPDPVFIHSKSNNSNVIASSSSPVTMTTASAMMVASPDSGCLTAEEEDNQHLPNSASTTPFKSEFGLFNDNHCDITSGMALPALSEAALTNRTFRNRSMQKPSPTKNRRKKHHLSSPEKLHSRVNSEPIPIPEPARVSPENGENSGCDSSPNGSPSRWRDAWSTDEESYPSMTYMTGMGDALKRDVRYSAEVDNIEVAPSSPNTSHFRPHHPHYHHRHHHHHHHHHNNHGNRVVTQLKLDTSVDETDKDERVFLSLQGILRALELNRSEHSRPEDVTLMTREEIRMEKVALERELLKHESRHGRPSSPKDRDLMRNVYNRYRTIKRLMADTFSPPLRTSLHHRNDVEQDYDVTNKYSEGDECVVSRLGCSLPSSSGYIRFEATEMHPKSNDHVSIDLGINELRKKQRQTKGEKKRLRREIRDFEREIQQQHGRSVIPADRVVMLSEYKEYRGLKAKLRLLDALIEKHNARTRSL